MPRHRDRISVHSRLSTGSPHRVEAVVQECGRRFPIYGRRFPIYGRRFPICQYYRKPAESGIEAESGHRERNVFFPQTGLSGTMGDQFEARVTSRYGCASSIPAHQKDL